jgi:hypothetical protein
MTLLAVIQLGFEYSFSGMVSVLPPVFPGRVWRLLLATAPLWVIVAAVVMVRRQERADAVE